MHGDRTVIVVASIAHVHVRLTDLGPDYVFNLLHLYSQRVAIIRISREALGADEPSATTAYRDTHLVAELILLARFALGDAFDLRLVYAVDLVLVMPLL